MTAYLRYSAGLEQIDPDETETFEKIANTFERAGEKVAHEEGRKLRVSHAKPTALLDGKLTVDDGLPVELAQGLAAQLGTYPAQVRFAQGPGELLDDSISTHRGMAIKLTGLAGDSISEAAEAGMQDFVLEGTGRAFDLAPQPGESYHFVSLSRPASSLTKRLHNWRSRAPPAFSTLPLA